MHENYSEYYEGDRGYDFNAIYTVGDYDDTQTKIRVKIHRDNYDFQSRFVAELWDGAQWHEAVTIAGLSPAGRAMPDFYAKDDKEKACKELAEKLVHLALQL